MAVFTENTLKLLKNRYFLRDLNTGEVIEKEPEEMFRRVAKHIASAEKEEDRQFYEDKFFWLMDSQYFMPNTPTLINSGKEKCLSACSVVGRYPDSLEGIYEYLWYNAKLTKSGCGVGQDLSAIRPKGEIIKSSGGISAGITNWMSLIQSAAETTIQGDTARRAANMVSLRFNHPDIFDFITSKNSNDSFTAMNISVVITDEEFKKAINREEVELVWNGKVYKKVNAGDILDKIIEQAWKNGEPGLIFIDRINQYNPFNIDNNMNEDHPHYMKTTNPCGEQCLEDFEFCNLGSINLEKMYHPETKFDKQLLREVIKYAVRFLDNVNDVNEYVLPQFKEKVLANRKIGLGVTGFAHLLILNNIKYDSQEALDFIDELYSFMDEVIYEVEKELAIEKGVFPEYDNSIWKQKGILMRNATVTTQAPTGSISSILNTESYGIEPIFSVGYIRRIVGGDIMEINQLFKTMLYDKVEDEQLRNRILLECIEKGTTELDIVPKELRELFRCANDISPEWHIKIVAQIQKYIHNSISKTVNLPEQTTKDDIRRAYIQSFNLGLKGCTVYRNNSREGQTIQIGSKVEEQKPAYKDLPRGVVYKVSDDLIGKKRKLQTGCGSMHLQAWFHPVTGDLMEVFFDKGSDGGCISFTNALSRMTSVALRSGAPIEAVLDQLNSIFVCPSYAVRRATKKDTSPGSSCPSAIGKALKEMYDEILDEIGAHQEIDDFDEYYEDIDLHSDFIEEIAAENNKPIFTEEETNYLKNYGQIAFVKKYHKCPECGEPIMVVEGCLSCYSCGFSKCS